MITTFPEIIEVINDIVAAVWHFDNANFCSLKEPLERANIQTV